MNRHAPPYPPSSVILDLEWDPPDAIIRLAQGKHGDGSDNWPLAWADDGHLYTAYGDGYGFDPPIEEKLSLGFARVEGHPPALKGYNIRSKTGETRGPGPAGKKASGMLMVDGTLYMLARNAGNAQLAWSTDHAETWTWADWRFTTSFGCPTFLNFGPDYAGARDDYAYIYSPDEDSAYQAADRMVLARVPTDRIQDLTAYSFLSHVRPDGAPVWTRNMRDRGAVFEHPGRCYRSGISHHPALERYLWCQILWDEESDTRFEGGIGIYEGPEPWGPWCTVFYTERWDVGPGETSSFPTKWMSTDGRTCHLVFSGNDNFSVRRAVFHLRGDG